MNLIGQISVAFALCGLIIGVGTWVGSIQTQAEVNESQINRIKDSIYRQNEKVLRKLDTVEEHVYRIDGTLQEMRSGK